MPFAGWVPTERETNDPRLGAEVRRRLPTHLLEDCAHLALAHPAQHHDPGKLLFAGAGAASLPAVYCLCRNAQQRSRRFGSQTEPLPERLEALCGEARFFPAAGWASTPALFAETF